MKMPKLAIGQNAGMTCFYDENTFLKFGVFHNKDKEGFVLQVVEHIGDENRKSQTFPIDKDKEYIYLKVVTNYLRRELLASFDGEKYTSILILDNVYYLCDEGLKKGKRFTGAMVGMYVFAGQNEQQESNDLVVEFDYFNYD